MNNPKSIVIIPARMGSTRFPGKPLAKINGIPMIEHVYKRACMIKKTDLVCVATCDDEIYDFILSIGGLSVMTSDKHERATERTAEALEVISKDKNEQFDIVVMIQGDEPMFNHHDIDNLVSAMSEDDKLNIINLMNMASDEDDFIDPNNVKVVIDNNNNALYYSREPIPSNWKDKHKDKMLIQTGLIAFRADYLKKFIEMEPSPLEEVESCDMLRVIENGHIVRMMLSETRSIGVDSPEDLKVAEQIMKKNKY